MLLIKDLLEKSPSLCIASRYAAMNGILYLAHSGDWSDARGHWLLYLFGGRAGARQIVAASVIQNLLKAQINSLAGHFELLRTCFSSEISDGACFGRASFLPSR
jgi:hypothetical protein